jgi:hypothetical protein
MLALANDHGDHSFLMIDTDYTNSGHINRYWLNERF